MFAIVKTGGKQYRVAVGDTIEVEKLPNAVGDKVTLADVLMVEQDGKLSAGKTLGSGAQVVAEVLGEARGKKVTHFSYRNKHRRRKTVGHRQHYTRLKISDIRL